TASAPTLVDLGCGTGVAGAAWAGACSPPPQIVGVDRHRWALGEAAWTYRALGLDARTRQGDAASLLLPKSPALIVAAFSMNELPAASRETLFERLLARAARGDRILVV